MNVATIRATPAPEKLVCEAARNDYRSEGVIGHTFMEIMKKVKPDLSKLEAIANDLDYPDPELVVETTDRHNIDELSLEIREELYKRSLIDDLISDGHWGPFEHPQITIAMEGVTRVSMAQITRHRHFTFDIMSLRYVGVEDADVTGERVDQRFQIPECIEEGEAATRKGVSEIDDEAEDQLIDAYKDSMEHYRTLLDQGVPQEEARKVLPMGTKVNIVMSGNARAWMHLLNIRGKANVQGEARRLADLIMDECQEWMPYTFSQYDEDVLPLKLNP